VKVLKRGSGGETFPKVSSPKAASQNRILASLARVFRVVAPENCRQYRAFDTRSEHFHTTKIAVKVLKRGYGGETFSKVSSP